MNDKLSKIEEVRRKSRSPLRSGGTNESELDIVNYRHSPEFMRVKENSEKQLVYKKKENKSVTYRGKRDASPGVKSQGRSREHTSNSALKEKNETKKSKQNMSVKKTPKKSNYIKIVPDKKVKGGAQILNNINIYANNYGDLGGFKPSEAILNKILGRKANKRGTSEKNKSFLG